MPRQIYALPRHGIPLEAIPLSTSGKVDRRKLQLAAETLTREELISYSTDKRAKSVPVTENGQRLCQLWARFLNIPADIIRYDDNFIRLGGDSILAMKFVAASREEGLVLRVADIFRSPRLPDLAMISSVSEELLDTDALRSPPYSLVRGAEGAARLYPEVTSQCDINVNEIEDLYPCTPFWEGVMVLSVKQPGAYIVQQSFQLPSDLSLNLGFFCLAWDTFAKSNPILRTRIIQTDTAGLMQVVVREPIQ